MVLATGVQTVGQPAGKSFQGLLNQFLFQGAGVEQCLSSMLILDYLPNCLGPDLDFFGVVADVAAQSISTKM